MGRIKQTFLKRNGRLIYERFKSDFNSDFENNKRKVSEFADIKSKSTRNKIAGYITKTINHQKPA